MKSFLSFPRTPAAGAAKQTLRCRAFRPVMTGCLYHYSIFGGQTQEVLAKNDDRKKKCFLRNLYQPPPAVLFCPRINHGHRCRPDMQKHPQRLFVLWVF